MKKTKHSEEKIIGAVKQMEAGRSAKEIRANWASPTRRCTTGRRSSAAWRSVTQRSCGRSKMRTGA